MKRIVLLAMVFVLIPSFAWSAKTTYIATNRRFNYVKIKEVKRAVAQRRDMTHPVQLDEQRLRAALASIKLSRSYLVKKKVDTQEVFGDRDIDFLAPNIVRAFAQAGPTEEVVFSYLSKNPKFILRDDRLNIARAWIHGNELHIKFEKLYAKIFGDIDKRGGERKAINRSSGLRVRLQLGPGQKMAVDDSDELILELNYDYAAKPQLKEAAKGRGAEVPAWRAEPPAALESTEGAESEYLSAKDRLETLDRLKKDGLITKKEYERKRQEILEGL
jgi:hypothetical protein